MCQESTARTGACGERQLLGDVLIWVLLLTLVGCGADAATTDSGSTFALVIEKGVEAPVEAGEVREVAVRVQNGIAQPVLGVRVSAEALTGGGALSPDEQSSGPDGVARFDWQLGSQAGPQQVRFRVGRSPGQAIEHSVVVTPLSVPQPPVVAAATSDAVVVTWTPVMAATRYEIRRGLSESGSWEELGEHSSPLVDSGLGVGNAVWYQVRACNIGGCSAWSSSASGATTPLTPLTPEVSNATPASLTVMWEPRHGAQRYDLQRRAGTAGSWILLTSRRSPFVDSGIAPGISYWYQVRSCNSGGCSAWSDSAKGTTGPEVMTLAATSVSASEFTPRALILPQGQPTTAFFEWGTAAELNELTASTPEPIEASAGLMPVGVLLKWLDCATTYYYRGVAAWSFQQPLRGSIQSVTTTPCSPAAPATPPAPRVFGAAFSANVIIDTVARATSYELIRSRTLGGPWTLLPSATVPSSNFGATFTVYDLDLLAVTPYFYRLRACNSNGCSNLSAPVQVVTPVAHVEAVTLTSQAFSVDTIRVPDGHALSLRITSVGMNRRVSVPATGQDLILPAGEERTLNTTALRMGAFTVFCTVNCNVGSPPSQRLVVVVQ